jgi:hypothetical protein
MKISKHLTLKEVIKSNTATRHGIDNTPTDEHLANLKMVANRCFEPIRTHFNTPIGISSGYRSKSLNKAVNGSKTSHHCFGMALDIDADMFGKLTNADIFNYIKDNLEYSQLIAEYKGSGGDLAWVHVSYDKDNLKKQNLIAIKGKGYQPYTKELFKSIYGNR